MNYSNILKVSQMQQATDLENGIFYFVDKDLNSCRLQIIDLINYLKDGINNLNNYVVEPNGFFSIGSNNIDEYLNKVVVLTHQSSDIEIIIDHVPDQFSYIIFEKTDLNNHVYFTSNNYLINTSSSIGKDRFFVRFFSGRIYIY